MNFSIESFFFFFFFFFRFSRSVLRQSKTRAGSLSCHAYAAGLCCVLPFTGSWFSTGYLFESVNTT